MKQNAYRLYPYRWIVLAVFMLTNLTIQLLWISYAPITGLAAAFYGVSDLQIGMLSMAFMIAFLPLSIPVSWMLDTWGLRAAVSIGAVLMGLCGIGRGLAGTDYTLALACTIGLAAAQPFLLNAWTKLPAQWFGETERATAVGLITLANLVGTGLGMVLTPALVQTMSIDRIQLAYGLITAGSAVLFLVFAREKPATPPCSEDQAVRALMLDGLKSALRIKPFWIYLFISFVGLGVFNGLSTWVEAIIRPRGFTAVDAGNLGAAMLVGGVIGAVVLPAISDKRRQRVPFLLIGFLFAIPGMLGITWARGLWLLLGSAFSLGFFLVSANPIGMQYAAEITFPTPEGTSAGLIQLFGQASVVFVYIMEALKRPDGSFTPGLLLMAGMMLLSCAMILLLKEPDRVLQEH